MISKMDVFVDAAVLEAAKVAVALHDMHYISHSDERRIFIEIHRNS